MGRRVISIRLNRTPKNYNNNARNLRAPARGRVHVIEAEEAVQNQNMMTGVFLLNGHFVSIIFDSGADRSFVSLEIRPLLEQKSKSLEEIFTIEYANGHEYEAREILLNCKLNLNDNFFNIDLIPIELKNFDVDGKTLVVQRDKPARNLKIISAIKMHKYLKRECFAFLAHVVERDQKVKSIQDIPVVKNYPEVFPENLLGPPPSRQVEFQIKLVPGAAPVAKALYRLAPSKM
ncbi:reverse transcriptase domain-containing protein [Tanacetum coccineum]|uniref:Reverse transcriptase domain-containing protein n=1 Tax=Tanacetum coccineum TaxID=301880 RepID=A0ABQ5G1G0_9ASTR